MILKKWNADRYEPHHITSVRHAMENLQDWEEADLDSLLIAMIDLMYDGMEGSAQ